MPLVFLSNDDIFGVSFTTSEFRPSPPFFFLGKKATANILSSLYAIMAKWSTTEVIILIGSIAFISGLAAYLFTKIDESFSEPTRSSLLLDPSHPSHTTLPETRRGRVPEPRGNKKKISLNAKQILGIDDGTYLRRLPQDECMLSFP